MFSLFPMYMHILIIFLLVNSVVFSQETNDFNYYFELFEGITIYRSNLEEFHSESTDAYVMEQINGTLSERRQFIETDILENAGFRRTGNVKYRKTDRAEKALSVLHGFARVFSFGLVPYKPFLEVDYERLPNGEYYKFESVFINSNFKNITLEVIYIIELEYMLQIEFINGIVIKENLKYYSDENISKFESLILKLPDHPESILQAKNRYKNELGKIQSAIYRYRNPSENAMRAIQNFNESFNRNR